MWGKTEVGGMVCALFYLEKDNDFFSAWICFSKENKMTFQAG